MKINENRMIEISYEEYLCLKLEAVSWEKNTALAMARWIDASKNEFKDEATWKEHRYNAQCKIDALKKQCDDLMNQIDEEIIKYKKAVRLEKDKQ
jgi:hypothetical protein